MVHVLRRPTPYLLNSAMLSHGSVYPAWPPRSPSGTARDFAALRDSLWWSGPDILRALAGERRGGVRPPRGAQAAAHERNVRSAAANAGRAQTEDVRVDHRGADVAVAEERLDGPDVVVVHDQMGGE